MAIPPPKSLAERLLNHPNLPECLAPDSPLGRDSSPTPCWVQVGAGRQLSNEPFFYPSPSPQVVYLSILLPTSAISFLSLTGMMRTKAEMKSSR